MFSLAVGTDGWLLPMRTIFFICRMAFLSAMHASWRSLTGGLDMAKSITGVAHEYSRDIWCDGMIYIKESSVSR